jgi:hypothetical protein
MVFEGPQHPCRQGRRGAQGVALGFLAEKSSGGSPTCRRAIDPDTLTREHPERVRSVRSSRLLRIRWRKPAAVASMGLSRAHQIFAI